MHAHFSVVSPDGCLDLFAKSIPRQPVTLAKSGSARVPGEQDVTGTISVRVGWNAALGRTAVSSAVLQHEGEGGDITSHCSARCERTGS